MNVLNRKMFANRDARRKLANMGGILASSPELMQTAQMFAQVDRLVLHRTESKNCKTPTRFCLRCTQMDGLCLECSVPLSPNDPIEASFEK